GVLKGRMMEFDQELDARGLMCPLPILKTKVALDGMRSGEVLKVVSTDAGSVRDMEAFALHTRNVLLDSLADGENYFYYLRKT
ncbi:MAG: sulfurtransferase TusA family protein, partial [Rhodothermales bacterium]|nr:sulfurtransferase TusA family protein [Rhodothermales bacterium]